MFKRPPECSVVIPTRDRQVILGETLQRLESLPDRDFEVIVCDNGSSEDLSGLRRRHPRVRWIELGTNLGCAARNVGAVAARAPVLLMLDDDSWPDAGVINALPELFHKRLDLGAAGLRVRLADPSNRHDAGGVAGTFFNCGAAIRRRAFLDVGGYPIDFEYYVEEYDLSCRLWQAGWSIEPAGDLIVRHRRVSLNRDNNNMVRLLVRNNLKLWSRFAPAPLRDELISSTFDRYERIAEKESAMQGFLAARKDSGAIPASNRTIRPLTIQQYERLVGIDRARPALRAWADKHGVKKVAVWTRGKSCESLLAVIRELSIRVEALHDHVIACDDWNGIPLRPIDQFDPVQVDGVVVGSLSCGVAEDLADELAARYPALPILCPVSYGACNPRLSAALA